MWRASRFLCLSGWYCCHDLRKNPFDLSSNAFHRPDRRPIVGGMPDLMPLHLLLATFAGWANRHQAQVIDYLVEENRVLKEQLQGRRVRLTDSQRRRLAAKGKPLGRRLLSDRTSSAPGEAWWRRNDDLST